MEKSYKYNNEIFAQKRCHVSDVELQIVHSVWLKYHFELTSKLNSRSQCLTIFISFRLQHIKLLSSI